MTPNLEEKTNELGNLSEKEGKLETNVGKAVTEKTIIKKYLFCDYSGKKYVHSIFEILVVAIVRAASP